MLTNTVTGSSHTEQGKDVTPPRQKSQYRDGIFNTLRSPGSYFTESITPAYVAWLAGTTTVFLLSSQSPWQLPKYGLSTVCANITEPTYHGLINYIDTKAKCRHLKIYL